MSQLIFDTLKKSNKSSENYQTSKLKIQEINLFMKILQMNWPTNTTFQRINEHNFTLRIQYQQCTFKDILFEINVDQTQGIIRFTSFFNLNLQPVTINSRQIKNQMLKILRKINSKPKFGFTSILTMSKAGILYIKCAKKFIGGLLNLQNLQYILNSTIKNLLYKICYFGPKLLDLSNQLPKDIIRTNLIKNYDQSLKQTQDRVNEIQKYLTICLFYKDISTRILAIENNQLIDPILIISQPDQYSNIQHQQIYYLQRSPQIFKIQNFILEKFKESLSYPIAKQGSNRGDNKYIFNYIKFINPASIKLRKFRQTDISIQKNIIFIILLYFNM